MSGGAQANLRFEGTPCGAPQARRVCQAWHRANRVQVPMSGKGEAED